MDKKMMQRLAMRYSTPFYVFDIETLRNDVRYLREIFGGRAELCYAAKANTFILKEISGMIDRFEICSPGELKICQTLGIEDEKIVLSGVYKAKEDIEILFKEKRPIGIYTVESIRQYLLLETLAEKYHQPIKLILRLSSGNQFGLSKEEIRSVISNIQTAYITVVGLQYYSGTQKRSFKVIDRELDNIVSFVEELKQECGPEFNILEYGPGLKVDYFDDKTVSDSEYLREVADRIKALPADLKIVLEIGRRMTANCGHYFTKVVDIKTNKEHNYAVVDGGIHQLAYFGQSMAMKIPPFTVLSSNFDADKEKWNVCGSLCTVNDILLKEIPVVPLGIGDTFVFHKAGAYCVSEGIALFLSRDIPDVILIDKKQERIVRLDQNAANLNCPKYDL